MREARGIEGESGVLLLLLTALAHLLVDSCDLHLEALREAQLVLQLDIRDRLLIKYTGGEEEGVVVSRGSGVSGE